MSKYAALWAHIQKSGEPKLTLTFDDIEKLPALRLIIHS